MAEQDRSLTPAERSVLDVLVAAVDSDAVSTDLEHLRVVGGCRCGCPTIHFTTKPGPRLVATAEVSDSYDTILLFADDDGRLSALELAWISDKPPAEFPEPSRLRAKSA